MDERNNWKNKNYYFNIFEQFSISNTWEINSTSPDNKTLDNWENIYSRSAEENPLYNKFKNLKKQYSETKDENIKIQERRNYESRSIINNEKWSFINKNIGWWCNSPTPCYNQWWRKYWNKYWPTWCTPTALSIVLWYYDRNWFPNILRNVDAPKINNDNIVGLQTKLWNLMLTTLQWKEWATKVWNNPLWWKILDWVYKYNYDFQNDVWYNFNNFESIIKNEINNWRPILIWYTSDKNTWHTIVWHWYKWNNIYVNFWWGPRTSNVALNLNWKNFDSNSKKIEGKERKWIFDRLDTLKIIK